MTCNMSSNIQSATKEIKQVFIYSKHNKINILFSHNIDPTKCFSISILLPKDAFIRNCLLVGLPPPLTLGFLGLIASILSISYFYHLDSMTDDDIINVLTDENSEDFKCW